jgi:antitoxin YefM
MKSLTASEARNELFRLTKDASKSHRTFTITHKDGDVVLMSKEDYESLIETLELLSIPGFLASIKKTKREIAEGKTIPMEEVFKEG